MKIAVLFDGAGLARLGLEQAGHECVGVELHPVKHHLSKMVGSGNSVLMDAKDFDLTGFDAVWASPPCSTRSTAIKDLTGNGGLRDPVYQQDHLPFSLALDVPVLWVENVTVQGSKGNEWGLTWNAAQFEKDNQRQNRNRVIGGRYELPEVYHPYRRWFPGVCPCVSATEWKGCASDKLRASRHYGRKLTLQEVAYHMGIEIPAGWHQIPEDFMPDYRHRAIHWERKLYEALGNGVPVWMARAFGEAQHGVYSSPQRGDFSGVVQK